MISAPSSPRLASWIRASRLACWIAIAAIGSTAPALIPSSIAAETHEKDGGLKFSVRHGFHSQPFELKLSSKKGRAIRWTSDGTLPSPTHGNVYSGPIPIQGTSIIRALAIFNDGKPGRAETQTYLFPSDIVRQSPDGFPPPGFPIRWGENRVDYGMDPDVTESPEYRDEMGPALRSLPTFSLVMDLTDLFGPKGIYSNSQLEGREQERPASVELIDPRGGSGFQINCGVRIRGGFSSMSFNPKHAFRLFFRKEYGEGKLEYPVFGPEAASSFDSFDLRCSQNYSWSLGGEANALFLRDQFNRDLQGALGKPHARGNFCHLYINGQYWGLYDTCERPEASYAKSYFGGSKEDYDVIKTGGIGGAGGGFNFSVAATDGSMEAWNRLHAAAKAGLADNRSYFKLQGRLPDGSEDPKGEVLLDPENLIDYMLVIFYGGNLDSPVTAFSGNRAPNNWHGLRNRNGRSGFKFFIWDAEHTFLDPDVDRTGPFPSGDDPNMSHPQYLWQQCLENAEFRQLLADRIHQTFGPGGVLHPAEVKRRFEARVAEIESAVVAESARWGDAAAGGGGPMSQPRPMRKVAGGFEKPIPLTRNKEWRAEVRRIVDSFIPKRSDVVLFQLWRQGLVSDLPTPTFESTEGSRLKKGSSVKLQAKTGDIFYTLDGMDPREIGGELHPHAARYENPIPLSQAGVLKARARVGKEWSPLAEIRFDDSP